MCELLALCFDRAVHPTYAFQGLTAGGEKNPNGWGMACYPDDHRAALIVKEARPVHASELALGIQRGLLSASCINIAHIRHMPDDSICCHANTHPFARTVKDREYIFAHNGTLHAHEQLSTLDLTPLGDTDTEYAFCHLLAHYESVIRKRNWRGLHSILQMINQRIENKKPSKLNCLLSDGEFLAAYRDLYVDETQGLYMLVRQRNQDEEEITMQVLTTKQEGLQYKDIKLRLDPNAKAEMGVLFATRKLTDEPWQQLGNGKLVVVQRGQVVYNS